VIAMSLTIAGWISCLVSDSGSVRGETAAVSIAADAANPTQRIESDWRRTSAGWIKVGPLGAAGLLPRAGSPTSIEPPLHPGVLAAFLALASVLSLVLFDERSRQKFSLSPR